MNRIKESFDLIHAEEEIKNSTKDFLMRKTGAAFNFTDISSIMNTTPASRQKHHFAPARIIPAVICLAALLFVIVAVPVYFTPSSVISIDINPSIELNLNCLDRVISVKSYNDDGLALKESLNVRFMNYRDALNVILDNNKITELLANDEVISIVVIDSDEKKCERILSGVTSCAKEHQNTFCHSANKGEVSLAHELGMSYGKYCAFLELTEFDSDITLEEVKGMTMREIRNLIKELSADSSYTLPDESPTEHENENSENEHHYDDSHFNDNIDNMGHHGNGFGNQNGGQNNNMGNGNSKNSQKNNSNGKSNGKGNSNGNHDNGNSNGNYGNGNSNGNHGNGRHHNY